MFPSDCQIRYMLTGLTEMRVEVTSFKKRAGVKDEAA